MVGASTVKSVLGLVAILAVAYLVVVLLFRLFEHQFIYFPNYPGRLSGDWQPRACRYKTFGCGRPMA